MMDSLYYLASIFGMAWLVAWVLRRDDAADKPEGFWPFDMKPAPTPPAPLRRRRSR